ncbi:hypothetical protein BJ944DRAFT_285579 [Cunninghamella echinulata]|nr:hypothetical protein BJ944DRAFT_285579 [Cunninghamella echinulata]
MPPQANSKPTTFKLPKYVKPYNKNSIERNNKATEKCKLLEVDPKNSSILNSKEIKAEGDEHYESCDYIKEKLEAIIALYPIKNQEYEPDPSDDGINKTIDHLYMIIQEYATINKELHNALKLEKEKHVKAEKTFMDEQEIAVNGKEADEKEEVVTMKKVDLKASKQRLTETNTRDKNMIKILSRKLFVKKTDIQQFSLQLSEETCLRQTYQGIHNSHLDKNVILRHELSDAKKEKKRLQDALLIKELQWTKKQRQDDLEMERLKEIERTWPEEEQKFIKNEQVLKKEASYYKQIMINMIRRRDIVLKKGKKRGSSPSTNEENSRKRQHTEVSQQNNEDLDF